MKIKSGYILHSIGDEHVVVPIDERTKEFHGMLRLNSTGSYLWNLMLEEFTVDSLLSKLQEEYDVKDIEEAKNTITNIISNLLKAGILDE